MLSAQLLFFAAMVFIMQQNHYAITAGEKKYETRIGTHEGNDSVFKKAKKDSLAAGL